MATFALVHGAFCGGWTWDPIVAQLESGGHAVIAPDLPCDDPEAGCATYAEVVVDALKMAPEPVVVVGHSLGGLTIPIVATSRLVSRMVFLAAFIPQCGRTFRDQFVEEAGMFPPGVPGTEPLFEAGGTLMTWPEHRVIPALMPDVDPKLAREAAARLRPQALTPHGERWPLTKWPDVPSSYVLCVEDTQVGADWARRAARERLQATAIELPGGHMPMLSRPDDLAGVLLDLAG
jgi:pimeloyl-ACP methyl ester carboxylesterase